MPEQDFAYVQDIEGLTLVISYEIYMKSLRWIS